MTTHPSFEYLSNHDMEKSHEHGYKLIGAAIEVYNVLGSGFLEEVYQESLEIELTSRNIPFVSQPELKLYFKETELKKRYRPDLYLYDNIVVELKAIKQLGNDEYAQLLNYLKGTKKPVGYLINFGASNNLEWKRFVF